MLTDTKNGRSAYAEIQCGSVHTMLPIKFQLIYISLSMDEFEDLQKRARFGQKALLIAVAVLLGLLLVMENFTDFSLDTTRTDETCDKYNNCQER